MRISDWSSDVCSSDLVVARDNFQLLLEIAGKERRARDGCRIGARLFQAAKGARTVARFALAFEMDAQLRIGVAAVLALARGRDGTRGGKGDDIGPQSGDRRVMDLLQLGNDVVDTLDRKR